MALGAFTQQNLNPVLTAAEPGVAYVEPGMKLTVWQFAGESSYAAGGSVIAPSQLGLGSEGVILWADVQIVGSTGANDAAIAASYNVATGKLQMWVSSGTSPVGLQEAAAAANLSGLTIQIAALGYPSL